jgi:hypothetical protein
MEVKEQEWEEWKLNPVTQALLHQFLPAAKQSLMDQWAAGQFQDETEDCTLARNAAALGQIELIDRLKELTLEDFNDTITEEEDKDHG